MASKFSRPLLALVVLALAALACNLGSDQKTPATSRPLTQPTLNPNIVLTLTAISTRQYVIQTPTPHPTRAGATQAPPVQVTQINCTPQTTWPVYTVAAGDTLGIIADYTGSTTAQLQQANCLGNADLIYVGDRLYVPRLPVVPTSAPATITFPNLPALTVAPFWLDTQGKPVTYSQTVRISAGEVLDAVTVNFYVNDAAGGTPISIGQDVDPWDGAFIDYTFFQPGTYTFSAVAASDDGQTNGTPFTVRYDPSFVPAEGVRNILTITPYLSFSGGVYNVQPGTTVTLRWPDAPIGALRIDFVFAPFADVTGVGTPLGTDLNATDGVYIAWGVTSGLNGYIQAFATMPDGSTITSEVINVNSVQ